MNEMIDSKDVIDIIDNKIRPALNAHNGIIRNKYDGYLISFNSFDVNLVIYLSGCTSNCAQKYSKCDIPGVVVAALTVDTEVCDSRRIVAEIVKRGRSFYEQLER